MSVTENVAEFDPREVATSRYTSEGLGGLLTQNSRLLMPAIFQETLGDLQGLAVKFACGSIVDRTSWLAFGVWIGYFNPIPPLDTYEQHFLMEYSYLFSSVGVPPEMQLVCEKLVRLNLTSAESFYNEAYAFFPLARPMPEWFPVFQSLLITQELLNEPAITQFFLFLQQGNLEAFRKRSPDPNGIFSRLSEDDYLKAFNDDFEEPEMVIAGFIRFTEFLSAMDGIFPNVDILNISGSADEIPDRIIDRYIISSFFGIYQWRFPTNEIEKYQAVIMAFSTLANAEFDRHPSMGITWSFANTFLEIMRLSLRFFPQANADFTREENDSQGIEDTEVLQQRQRRLTAIQRRVSALGVHNDPLAR